MKIAVALYGQPRHYKKGYENIMKILQEQGYSTNSIDVDFFIIVGRLIQTNNFRVLLGET